MSATSQEEFKAKLAECQEWLRLLQDHDRWKKRMAEHRARDEERILKTVQALERQWEDLFWII